MNKKCLFVSIDELSEMLGVTRQALHQNADVLPPKYAIFGGNKKAYLRAEIEEYLSKVTNGATERTAQR